MIENEPDPLRRIPTKNPDLPPTEVGAVLRAARLKRGQSVQNVAEQTRIPKRYLEALENDRLDEFPAFVYMRGFLKGYCDYLEVSFDELWSRIEPAVLLKAGGPAISPAKAHHAAGPSASTPTGGIMAVPAAAGAGASATGALLLALALGVGLGVWILKDVGQPPPARPQESTPRALLPLARPVETKVSVKAIDDAWAQVAVDGGVVFEGRIPRGASMEWKPTKFLTLRTTAPTALQVMVNGAPRALEAPTPGGEYRIDIQ